MTASEREAYAALRLDWARTPEDVWKPSAVHVDGLHAHAARAIEAGIADAAASDGSSPIGVVVRGQRGAGKTHLLGWVREQAQRRGGYFFLVGPLSGTTFWESVAGSMLENLLRDVAGGGTQLAVFLRRLSALFGVSDEVRDGVAGDLELAPEHLKDFIVGLRTFDRRLGSECQDTLRAMVLYGASDFTAQDVGQSYLQSMEEQTPGERATRGMRTPPKPARQIVAEMSRLLALTGPSVIAIDQIDTVIAETTATTDPDSAGRRLGPGPDDGATEWHPNPMFDQVADGLLVLRDITARTLCVVACLPSTWELIRDHAVATVSDRFRELTTLSLIETPALAREIVAKRFADRFQKIYFKTPYPTWPVREAAFADATAFTPRQLIQRIDRHVQACLRNDAFPDLERFATEDEAATGGAAPKPTPTPTVEADELERLDARFAELRGGADGTVDTALAAETEDAVVPRLLAAGLTAWIAERGADGDAFRLDPRPGRKPALHARLRQTLDENTGDEIHWAFRAIASGNGNAALNRIRAAGTMAGIDQGTGRRHLFLLRNAEWSPAARTREALGAFTAAGGVTVPLDPGDLAAFAALATMLAEKQPSLREWLISRRPASDTKLLSEALPELLSTETVAPVGVTPTPTNPTPTSPTPASPGAARPVPSGSAPPSAPAAPTAAPGAGPVAAAAEAGSAAEPAREPAPTTTATGAEPRAAVKPAVALVDPTRIAIGATVDGRVPVGIELESLRRHTAIFAGSGSGKTVLIRRLVEECALRGVSSVVLDPNNDLARLGDPWPRPPAGWGPGDAERAADYLAGTDVVVWTPRKLSGRPLSFQPLPDFRGVIDDPDEFEVAIDTAAVTLAARANVGGSKSKASLGEAVLRQALRRFARDGETGLPAFLDLLADLPVGVSQLNDADKVAAGMAQMLRAAMVNDPLFGGRGEPVDPSLLLTPPPGKRARVSVISLVGLPGDEQRQSFVNQLQMALFAWVKKNPAGDRPLGGLFVMDEAQTFAPSGGMTACTTSTVALASQARKYGLGLVFATQAPKGLHNQISGNATTQFFGLLNSPVQIAAAQGMAKVKGGDAADIGRLKVGQFYAAGDGVPLQKLQTPLCLSHHPKSPLTAEEVVERARRAG